MLKIGLTGGIGTGKTYISRHFIEMGIPVFYADEETKKLYREPEIQLLLRSHFGDAIFTDNQLDFRKMGKLFFSSPEALQQANALIHPLVTERFNCWASKQQNKAVMMESAIIFEAGLASFFDKIFVVDAPLEVRIRRIQTRNPEWSKADILKRINAQMNQEEKCRLAHLVIWNE
ncbi:MAG: dephospho-CoA kinase [Bacteroidales bacterium]|jgi:dephospho-CoA kinase|nr:dephospho-CoA kinase [Bacteroidales bacterium]